MPAYPPSYTINFTNLTAAINYNNITSAAGDAALIIVQSTGGITTAFYYYLEDGVSVNYISASELSILSTTDMVTAQTTDASLL